MAVLTLTLLVVAMVTMTMAAPVIDNKSTHGVLVQLLRELSEGSGKPMQYINYPLQFNFDEGSGRPMAYCHIQDGPVDIVRPLFAKSFQKLVGDKCLHCTGCSFNTASGGMSCTKLSASGCTRR